MPKKILALVVVVMLGGFFALQYSKDERKIDAFEEVGSEIARAPVYQDSTRKEIVALVKSQDDPGSEVYVHSVVGNYASGGAGGDGPGYLWLAMRTDGEWEIIARGNETWSCQKMDEYSVPLEVYKLCNDYKNGGQRVFEK
jgi:hypothetical protein